MCAGLALSKAPHSFVFHKINFSLKNESEDTEAVVTVPRASELKTVLCGCINYTAAIIHLSNKYLLSAC